MSGQPDMQLFVGDGTWCKPPDAEVVDIILKGGDGGVSANGLPAQFGEIIGKRFRAEDLPSMIEVKVGTPRAATARDGYALIVTHLGGQQ